MVYLRLTGRFVDQADSRVPEGDDAPEPLVRNKGKDTCEFTFVLSLMIASARAIVPFRLEVFEALQGGKGIP
jgi:hypothetical protein